MEKKKPAEALPTLDRTASRIALSVAIDEFVADLPVISFPMIVLAVFSGRAAEVALTNEITCAKHSNLIEQMKHSAYASGWSFERDVAGTADQMSVGTVSRELVSTAETLTNRKSAGSFFRASRDFSTEAGNRLGTPFRRSSD